MSKRTIVLAFGAILALLVGMQIALASDPHSLNGSNFEIDDNANLVTEHDPPSIDWDSVGEVRKGEEFTGAQDDSFGEGTKENTANPTIVDGGIPPNKSDLKEFGVYQEGDTSSGFLNLFWTRVQDPSGTTNMDFELNQNKCELVNGQPTADSVCAGNGITPRRTTGDILIIYDLSNGGTNASISFRKWQGGQTDRWGPLTNLTTLGEAVGTINTSSISAAAIGGTTLDARTFGEAQVRMSALFQGSTACRSFGSAYLKSRSSDSFTAALKDFIAPVPVDITNCGSVKVIKTDDAGTPLAGAQFTLYNDVPPIGTSRNSGGVTDPITNPALRCTTALNDDDNNPATPQKATCTINNVPFGEYWVVETITPAGHTTAADQHATVSASTPTITLTFVDARERGAILVHKERKHAASGAGDHDHAGVDFTVNGVTKTTDANGEACFDNLLLGSYNVTETVPTGYSVVGANPKSVTVNNAASCSDTTYVGETVEFDNLPLTDITVSVNSQVTGGTNSKITCTNQAPTPADGTPNAFDDTSETVVNLEPGTYTCTVVVDP